MNRAVLGVLLTLVYVLLEATQFVYFGGLFQRMSSFEFGFFVFGLTTLVLVAWTALGERLAGAVERSVLRRS